MATQPDATPRREAEKVAAKHRGMPLRLKIKIILVIVAAVLLLILLAQNVTKPGSLNFLFWTFPLPLAVMLLVALGVGFVAGMLTASRMVDRER